MEKVEYLILGAGAAGLTVANRLKELGVDSFYVLESEKEAGGLCRSVITDGSPIDIGGGHFLDVRRPEVNKFLFQFMPCEEWNIFERDSRIEVMGENINHPMEANIWQMSVDSQIAYLTSIFKAGCNQGEKMPLRFTEWIRWKLGDKIADDYMLPYNSKMFGEALDSLGTYWLDKLPNVSFEETLRSCLEKKAYGKQPGHASFYYPKKYGYGELWRRMAEALSDRLICNKKAEEIDFIKKHVKTQDGSIYQAEKIIVTIPWNSVKVLRGMPEELYKKVRMLKHTGVEIRYHKENMDTKAHWIYYPDPALSYHRILVRSNFCTGSRGYWTETNLTRVKEEEGQISAGSFRNEYAYPLNTIGKQEIMKELLAWTMTRSVYGLGRWGEHEHYNSDRTVELALKMAEDLLKE